MQSKKYEKEVEENERAFQEALSLWVKTQEKQYWDTMFYCVQKSCLYMAKSKCYGIVVRDLNDKVMDATLDVMNKIKNDGVRPEKLSSFCYLYTIGKLWSKKEIRWDRAPDISLFLNNAVYSMEINDDDEIVIECSDDEIVIECSDDDEYCKETNIINNIGENINE